MMALAGAALEAQGRVIDSPLDVLWGGTTPTRLILLILLVFSLVSWVLIIWKWRELRAVNEQADRFVDAVEGARGLLDLHDALRRLEDSPFARVFREGVTFFSDLRPGALEGTRQQEGLTSTQLDALWLVLEKNLSEERDELSHGLTWLAIIGSVSPLMGLMGTVVGIMNSFIGIASQGSANIAVVAPGIAEALTTTVAGLAVAIPAVIAYNHYASKLRLFVTELEGFASEFIGTLARENRL